MRKFSNIGKLLVVWIYFGQFPTIVAQELATFLSNGITYILPLPDYFDMKSRNDYVFDEEKICYLNRKKDSLICYNFGSQATQKLYLGKGKWRTLFLTGNELQIATQTSFSHTKIQSLSFVKDEMRITGEIKLKKQVKYLYSHAGLLKCAEFNNLAKRNYIYSDGAEIPLEYDKLFFVHMAPSNHVDFTASQSLFVHPDQYKLTVYNQQLKQISSIDQTSNPSFFYRDSIAIEEIRKGYVNNEPKGSLGAIQNYTLQHDFIWGATFLSDSLILIKKSITMTYFFDLWQFSENKWNLVHANINNVFCEMDDVIGSTCLPFNINAAYTKYAIRNNKFIVFKQDIPEPTIGMKFQDYLREKEKYYENHQPCYKIFTYDITF